jgi:hypothetical protein
MAITWGATTLKVVPNTYSPITASNGLVEIALLPDGTTNPASIIQQGGRGRKTVSMSAFTTTYSAYTALRDDYLALTTRTFADGNDSLTMIISELSPATKTSNANKWDFTITFMEA